MACRPSRGREVGKLCSNPVVRCRSRLSCLARSRDFDAESPLRSLMQNVPGAIYRCAMDGFWKMQRVSEEIESISGYPASDFVDATKRTLVSVTHPDDRDAVDSQINAAIAAYQPYALEFRVIHADGSIRWVLERGMKTV